MYDIGQGQPRVIIYIHFVELEFSMLLAKFQNNRFLVLEKKILKVFYHIWAWRPSYSCDLDYLYKILFPLPTEAPHKIWL